MPVMAPPSVAKATTCPLTVGFTPASADTPLDPLLLPLLDPELLPPSDPELLPPSDPELLPLPAPELELEPLPEPPPELELVLAAPLELELLEPASGAPPLLLLLLHDATAPAPHPSVALTTNSLTDNLPLYMRPLPLLHAGRSPAEAAILR
jgi:hypothetical protein